MRKYILILRLTPHISGIQGAGIDQGLGMPDVHGVQGQPGQGETRHGGPLCFKARGPKARGLSKPNVHIGQTSKMTKMPNSYGTLNACRSGILEAF